MSQKHFCLGNELTHLKSVTVTPRLQQASPKTSAALTVIFNISSLGTLSSFISFTSAQNPISDILTPTAVSMQATTTGHWKLIIAVSTFWLWICFSEWLRDKRGNREDERTTWIWLYPYYLSLYATCSVVLVKLGLWNLLCLSLHWKKEIPSFTLPNTRKQNITFGLDM